MEVGLVMVFGRPSHLNFYFALHRRSGRSQVISDGQYQVGWQHAQPLKNIVSPNLKISGIALGYALDDRATRVMKKQLFVPTLHQSSEPPRCFRTKEKSNGAWTRGRRKIGFGL